jgi:hypothetical protein
MAYTLTPTRLTASKVNDRRTQNLSRSRSRTGVLSSSSDSNLLRSSYFRLPSSSRLRGESSASSSHDHQHHANASTSREPPRQRHATSHPTHHHRWTRECVTFISSTHSMRRVIAFAITAYRCPSGASCTLHPKHYSCTRMHRMGWSDESLTFLVNRQVTETCLTRYVYIG